MFSKYFMIVFLFLCLNFNIYSQEKATQEQIDQFFMMLLSYKNSQETPIFSPLFLSHVPDAKILEIRDHLKTYGAYKRSTAAGSNKIEIFFEKASMQASVYFNSEGKVEGLWFSPPRMIEETLDKVKEDLLAWQENVSLCVRKNGQEVYAIHKSIPMGVGSAFKLLVLKELANKISKGEEKWDRVVLLDPKHKSLPSGTLQTWPDNTPLTIATMANMMISISDNTATDLLIETLGRESIEKISPERMQPFLKTIEMFKIKWGMDEEKIKEYLQSDLSQKRIFLQSLDKISKDSIKIASHPTYIDSIEWLLTTEELCQIIESMQGIDALYINPGIPSLKTNWKYIAYKGGSEPGVFNMTFLLQKEEKSDTFSVSLTANNHKKDIDANKFIEFMWRIIAFLK